MKKIQKADAIIVLGRGINSDGTIPKITQYRAEKAAELFNKKLAKKIIISAGYWGFQRPIPPNTEAKPMERILIKKGVPKSAILFEENSRETLGNAYFTRLIVDNYKWKKIIVVTSRDHLKRTKFYFEKVFGKKYKLQFSLAKDNFSEKDIKKIERFGKISLRLVNLKKIKTGDIKKIKEYLFKHHIIYNGSILKKIIPFFIKQPYNK